MRSLIPVTVPLSVIAAALCLAAPASRASDGPWCARYAGGQDYVEDCSMRSFDMCLNEIRGTGGSAICSPNPRYHGDVVREPRRRKVRHRRRRHCGGLDLAPCVYGAALVS